MSSFEERRRQRAAWPVRRYRLGEEPLFDERGPASVDERVACVWLLTQEAWAVSGKPWPAYERGDMPGRLLRQRP